MKYFFLSFVIVVMHCIVACKPKTTNQQEKVPETLLSLGYATGFSIGYFQTYKEIKVFNPWEKGEVLARYYLVQSDTITTPTDGIRIQVPIKSLAPTSTTHIGFLDALNEFSTIKGVCSPNLIYNTHITDACKAGVITDLGDALSINVEKTMQLQPQAVMMSGYEQNDTFTARLKRVHIPVIINTEWMETNLLARAEWIKFVAAFYNKETFADSIFNYVEKQYLATKAIPRNSQVEVIKPTILTGGNFRGTWYVPSGKGYMGQLFADAGADYFYANDTTSGSLPLHIETIMSNFANADVWVGSFANSLKELKNTDAKHTLFKAYKKGQVYNFNKRVSATGANDFWEMGVSRPDLILADMIKVLYPHLMQEHDFVFVEQLK